MRTFFFFSKTTRKNPFTVCACNRRTSSVHVGVQFQWSNYKEMVSYNLWDTHVITLWTIILHNTYTQRGLTNLKQEFCYCYNFVVNTKCSTWLYNVAFSFAAICHGYHSTLFRTIQENIQYNQDSTERTRYIFQGSNWMPTTLKMRAWFLEFVDQKNSTRKHLRDEKQEAELLVNSIPK